LQRRKPTRLGREVGCHGESKAKHTFSDVLYVSFVAKALRELPGCRLAFAGFYHTDRPSTSDDAVRGARKIFDLDGSMMTITIREAWAKLVSARR